MKTRFDLIDIEDLPTELIRKRNECNVTQEDLAKMVNTSNTCISAIENNKRKIHLQQFAEMFKSMGYRIQIAITEVK